VSERQQDPNWIVEQAWEQVGRATTSEDRARALSTFRRAIATATKHAGEATPELLGRIHQLEDEASRLYDEASDQHVRKAIRALGSLRMAVEARLGAHAGRTRTSLRFMDYNRKVLASMDVDHDAMCEFYGIPEEFRDGRVAVQLHFSGDPDVRVYRGRKLVWRKPAKPRSKPEPRMALPHEAPSGNGHRGSDL
jgi:hypothetical protein